MGNSPSTRVPSASNRGFASTISSTFSKHKTDVEHSQSTTAVQFQKDLVKHQKEEEEYEYLAKLTTFDSYTLRLLKGRFDTIDQTIQKDGQISIEEFAKVLEMDSKSMLLRRFFKFMDKSSMGSLNFRNFATALSLLSLAAPDEDKMKLSFFLYDINDDKQIDRDECTKMVKLALNEINMKLSIQQIEVIVNNTFREADMNGDGVIDYEEYKMYCKKNPRVLEPFRIDIAALVLDEQENRRGRRVSQVKPLKHWPTDTKKKNKMLRKIKKSVPAYMKREKVERVRSIHNAQQIMGLDDDDKSQGEYEKKKKKKKKTKKKKKQRPSKSIDDTMKHKHNDKHNKKSVSLERSNTDSTSEFDSQIGDDDDDEYGKSESPGPAKALRFALSADSAERKRKKKQKYSKNKQKVKTKTKNKTKKKKMEKNIPKTEVIMILPDLSEATALGLNTSVPRTPPKSKEKPKIKQSDLDAIERLLN